MTHLEFCSIAERLLRCPTAPYHEELVAAECKKLCAELDLSIEVDTYGNLLVRLKTTDQPPLILGAHMDHPGFTDLKAIAPKSWSAKFRGRVGDEYFDSGVPLLLVPQRVPAVLGNRLGPEEFDLFIEPEVGLGTSPHFAVWDLPGYLREEKRILGRACDDLIGVASILCVLAELKRSGAGVHVIGAITRAEEVGFHGALALAKSGLLPRDGLLISLETSKEIPPVVMGGGVIVRVGDRASTFDSAATRFLVETGSELSQSVPAFRFQRGLMSGGTCEATAYQEFGYRTAAVCIALGNYHNCGENRQIAPEFVHEDDALSMVDLLAQAALNMPRYAELSGRLPKRLEAYAQEAMTELRQKPLGPG